MSRVGRTCDDAFGDTPRATTRHEQAEQRKCDEKQNHQQALLTTLLAFNSKVLVRHVCGLLLRAISPEALANVHKSNHDDVRQGEHRD